MSAGNTVASCALSEAESKLLRKATSCAHCVGNQHQGTCVRLVQMRASARENGAALLLLGHPTRAPISSIGPPAAPSSPLLHPFRPGAWASSSRSASSHTRCVRSVRVGPGSSSGTDSDAAASDSDMPAQAGRARLHATDCAKRWHGRVLYPPLIMCSISMQKGAPRWAATLKGWRPAARSKARAEGVRSRASPRAGRLGGAARGPRRRAGLVQGRAWGYCEQ
jgi:hypothetical protein